MALLVYPRLPDRLVDAEQQIDLTQAPIRGVLLGLQDIE